MATMYHLELTNEATPLDRLADLAETVRATATRLGLVAPEPAEPTAAAEAPEATEAPVVLTSGLVVDVDRPFVTGEDTFVADFGMARAATVNFTIDGRRDPDRQFDELLQLVFGLLAAVPGDAVLHYEYAEVWLVRREGRLVLTDDDVMWPPDERARIAAPYQRSHLAFTTT